MEKEKILHIHVRNEYFELAKNNQKNKEYIEIKPYWIKALSKKYDLIYYYNAYTSEKLIFKYKGWIKLGIKHKEFGDKPVLVFAIDLSEKIV